MTSNDIMQIKTIVHETIYQFFDICEDEDEVPISEKDKLLLSVNKAICNNIDDLGGRVGAEHD